MNIKWFLGLSAIFLFVIVVILSSTFKVEVIQTTTTPTVEVRYDPVQKPEELCGVVEEKWPFVVIRYNPDGSWNMIYYIRVLLNNGTVRANVSVSEEVWDHVLPGSDICAPVFKFENRP
jgi:hypothetical protein